MREEFFQVGEGVLHHLAVAGIRAGVNLLQDVGASQQQGVPLAARFGALWFGGCLGRRGSLRLRRFDLRFYGFAFPTSGHTAN